MVPVFQRGHSDVVIVQKLRSHAVETVNVNWPPFPIWKLCVSLTETNPFGRARQASDTKGEGEGSLNDFTKRDDDPQKHWNDFTLVLGHGNLWGLQLVVNSRRGKLPKVVVSQIWELSRRVAVSDMFQCSTLEVRT